MKMKPTTVLASASVVFGVLQVTIATLNPACSKIPFKPGCTHKASSVTPSVPLCPLPFEEWSISARAVRGNSPRPNGAIPPWFNRALALRGQQVTSEYRVPVYIAIFFGLLIELNMPDIRNPLMFNKKHTTGPDNAKRDMATLMQGLIWTKDYFHSMPTEGNSSYIDSIQSVYAIHMDVEARANAKLASEGCIVHRHEYANQTTNDVMWDAFEADIKNSKIPASQRAPSPTNWPTCPPQTECNSCRTCNKCEPCKGPNCTPKCTECSGCEASTCKQNGCKYAEVRTYKCGECICPGKNTNANCGKCKACTTSDKCLKFTPPIFNQQAMMFVVYLFTAYPILFPKELAVSACDADLWAFNHLFATVGYGLGIDDKYNVLLQPDLKSARVYYKKMHEQIIIPSLFTFNKQTRLMIDNVFKGLSSVTRGVITSTFLLHRFVHNFLNQPAPRLKALMTKRELLLDNAMDFVYMPQFMNSPTYRSVANNAWYSFVSTTTATMFKGKCKDYKTSAKKCFV